jgi:hypothetical protein
LNECDEARAGDHKADHGCDTSLGFIKCRRTKPGGSHISDRRYDMDVGAAFESCAMSESMKLANVGLNL